MSEPNVVEFVAISGTDEELAKYYLKENNNDMERALNMYFANQSCQEDEEEEEPDPEGEVICLDNDEEDIDDEEKNIESEVARKSPSSGPSFSDAGSGDQHTLKLICWNIQGLDEDMLEQRTGAVINILKRESPDVIFLQEVIPPTLNMLRHHLHGDYHVFSGGKFAYFAALLIKKKTCNLKTVMVEPFPNSQMLRHLIIAKVTFHGVSLQLMTSHIESMAAQSEERKSQLRSTFARMTGAGSDTVSIFGADTNAKDHEISDLAGDRKNVDDVWEMLGSPPESCFTWDMSQNDNLHMNGRKPRLRFDRVYVHQKVKQLLPMNFSLIGKERLACGMFASDHWGILTHFNVLQNHPPASSGT